MKRIIFVLLLSTFSLAQAAPLEVTIDNIESNEGFIRFTLFNEKNADNFPSTDNRSGNLMLVNPQTGEKGEGIVLPAKVGKITFTVQVPPGIYAAAAFHDQDNNEELNKVIFIGAPTEPYGFSNNARESFSSPSFEKAKFRIPKSGKKISFDVK